MTQFNIIIPVTEYSSIDELSQPYADLIRSAYTACSRSYAPYSQFCVGAAILLDNNEIIQGCNQENVAYPSCVCAERVALSYANSLYPDIPVVAIAITASVAGVPVKDPVYPCGLCRQSLLQSEYRFLKNIRVIMAGSEKIRTVESICDLLPLAFYTELRAKN
jgi:cytidine deaminase